LSTSTPKEEETGEPILGAVEKRLLALLELKAKVIPTVISVTGDEIIRCLEELEVSEAYYPCPSQVIKPGEDVTFRIIPPPGRWCIVSRGVPMSDLHYDVSLEAQYVDRHKRVISRKSIERLFPEHSNIPIVFIWCQPRAEYRYTFTNNHPTADATVCIDAECHTITEQDYKAVRRAILGRVYATLKAHGLKFGKVEL